MPERRKMGLTLEKTSDLKQFARLRLTERGSKEEPMSEYRRDDTASWDAQEVRRAQGERRPSPAHRTQSHTRRWRRRNPVLSIGGYLIFVLLASAILAGVGWMLGSDFCAFNRGGLEKATVEVTAEDSVSTVADKLHDAGLIKYKWFFKLYAGISHADKKIGIGTYELNTEMDYRALILGMHNSSGNLTAETVTVTIPEGYTVMQTIHLLAEKGVNTEENLLEAAKTANYDYSFIDNSSEDVSRLEGYLFPDTYEFYKNHNAKSALGKLIDAFADHFDEDAYADSKAKAMGYSVKDVVTIASLIEKETDGTDQANIASVIYNRLQNKGETVGLLQIDAALLYGLPDHTGAITNEDKATDTPYNLYLHKGLPPTPIANPGSAALEAAMNPNDTDYYFYALGTDGKHHFSRTLAEHNAFVGSSSYGG